LKQQQNIVFVHKCRRCLNRFVGPSGGVVLLLLDAAGAAGCSPLHGVGGGVQRGAGRRLIAGSVVDQVLREYKYYVYKIICHKLK